MPEPSPANGYSTTRRGLLAGAAALAAGAAPLPGIPPGVLAQDGTPAASTPVVIASAPVDTATGPVTGLERDGVIAYKGIPYAAPPLGELRWTGPQPAPSWPEPLAADGFCPDCMQVAGPDDVPEAPSEDCLCLNVWQPADSLIDALLPVMVWIHGGGYVGGGSSDPAYDGATFARQGIVVVSINYRLGRFGFFAPSAVLANTSGPYANYGYLDQIAALRWVQENISSFGGDPHRVTVAGESAGGASILHLMTSPAVEDGLFHQAVILSGGGREALLDRPMAGGASLDLSATAVDDLFAVSARVVGNDRTALGKLRALPAEALVDDLDLEKLVERRLLGVTLPGVPAVDGELVVGQPQDHFLDGTAKLMPVIIGTTSTDVPTHLPPNKLHPLSWFGPDEDAAREAYGHGTDRFLGLSELIELNLSIGTDLTMHEPAHFVASTMQNAGYPAWVYRFTYTAESTRPEHESQIHAGELPFLFDTLASSYGDAVTANDRATATAFHTYVANFVHRGDPNGDGLPAWPAVTPDAYDVMDFTLDDGPVYGPDPRPSVALVAAARERHHNENLP